MPHVLVDGVVSDIQRGSETSGSGSSYRGTGQMHVQTTQLTVMRIGGQPAELKSKNLFIVKDGERVIAAGKTKHGVLRIGAARNLSAGTYFHPPVVLAWVGAALLIVLGIPLSVFLIGIPFLLFGIYVAYMAVGWMKSIKMVEAAAKDAKPR